MGNYRAESRQSAWKPVTTFCIALRSLQPYTETTFLACLSCGGAKVIGLISYSVYLLHGILLFVVMRIVAFGVPDQSPFADKYWVPRLFCGLLTLVLSAVTYRFVEYPW